MNPITKFKEWYEGEVIKTKVRIPSACCLSSIGENGYPNSRYVSLKEILDDKFVITGPMNSRKGKELLINSKASLTFWWTETERQIRIQGDAIQIEKDLADKYFEGRNKESQIVSQVSEQGAEVDSLSSLLSAFEKQKEKCKNIKVERPADWSGFYIVPKRIEFMEFKENRFHSRELFSYEDDKWSTKFLQP